MLYVCSSGFVARNSEARLRARLDRAAARPRRAVRRGRFPGPPASPQRGPVGRRRPGRPAGRVWPRFGEAPHDEESRRNFYDSIFHAAAVVGINTTAQIESAIVGRPVHTLLAEEFRDTQQGTLHFHYLKADEFGLLFVGRDFEEHAGQLAESVRGRQDDGRNERFLRRFVRPQGLDRPAKELIADAIEELGSSPCARARTWAAARTCRQARAGAPGGDRGQRADRRREQRAARATPPAGLRRVVRKRALHEPGLPVVAGSVARGRDRRAVVLDPVPALDAGDETGLSDRLFVVCRRSSTSWYEGIGAGLAELEQLVRPDRPDLSEALSESELQGAAPGARGPRVRPRQQSVPGASGRPGRDHPLTPRPAEAAGAWATPAARVRSVDRPGAPRGGRVARRVRRDALRRGAGGRGRGRGRAGSRRSASTASTGRRRLGSSRARGGLSGRMGWRRIFGVLLGRPAVVLGAERADADDLSVASSFLAGPPFGRLHVLDAAASPTEVAKHAARLLTAPVEALAGV